MKLSRRWIGDWLQESLPPVAELADKLTLAGLEVESVEPAGAAADGVVVARILSAEKHPQADRLKICKVDDGSGTTLQIVCGAPNARAGLMAPLARVGTVLQGGMKIKPAKLRGVESSGMLCSGDELGLGGTEGLLELPAEAPLGQPLAGYLGLDDEVIEIALTPDRGDCLSVVGVARELACILDDYLVPPFEVVPHAVTSERSVVVELQDQADCSAYAGRVVQGLDPTAETPLWMTERLRRAGLRSLGPLVDVTNYVLLELGQPMHAFDLAKLQGDILVRRARPGEALTLLNEQQIELNETELVITDASGPVALAGAMGGAATAIGDGSTAVFLESACFSPAAVAGVGRRFKLSSDSLHRFERGVDPDLQVRALERATQLLIDMAGGEAGPVVLAGALRPARQAVRLRLDRLRRLLGVEVPPAEVNRIFAKLGFAVQGDGDALAITPPSFRYDIEIEEDLIEEVARIYGYDRLVARERRVPVRLRPPQSRSGFDEARAVLVNRGYFETLTYSFVAAELDEQLAEVGTAIALDNPMSASQAVMRRSLWASLIPVWQHNRQRQRDRVRLFECARSYAKVDGQLVETDMVSGIVSGNAGVEQWAEPSRRVDFFDVKADLQCLFDSVAGGRPVAWQSERHKALHPGQSAAIYIAGERVGWLGVMHPALVKKLDLPGHPIVFELSWERLATARPNGFQPVGDFPSVRRDLALLVPDDVPVGDLTAALKASDVPSLQSVQVFDLYRGDALPKGFKSVALGLIFQEKTRTLIDEEVDSAVADVASRLGMGFGARIRD